MKKHFIGRKEELKRLKNYENQSNGILIAIRGRRRIGKSRLIEEFAKDKKFFKISGLAPNTQASAENQRSHFADMLEGFGMTRPDDSNWHNLFLHLAKNLPKGQCVVLLDEVSWMAKGDDTFLAKLKDVWDDYFKKQKGLIFVVCGSVSSWIEKNIISSTAFFGRVNETITLKPLSLKESLELLATQGFKGSSLEKFMALSITGGIPWYIEQFTKGQNAESHIQRLCFHEDGLLVNEFDRIFHDLFDSRASIYRKIVATLASGTKDYQSISELTDYGSSGTLSEYLDDLEVSGFIRKDKSWSLKTGKIQTIMQYRLSDNYLRFYLKIIEPNLTKIELGHFKETPLNSLKGFYTLLGLQFENWVLGNRELTFEALEIKRQNIIVDNPFIQRAGKTQTGCQIDYMIQTEHNTLYICEIKLTKNMLTKSVIEQMKLKIKALKKPKQLAIMPVLIHFGEISNDLQESDYFFKIINFEDFLH